MRGRPLTMRCPKCKLKAVSGAYWKIVWLGEQKETYRSRPGKLTPNKRAKYLNRCGACDYEFWSTYCGLKPEARHP